MDLGIAGRIALVCASTSGLGLATATALAGEGARVVITGRRAEFADQLAAELPGAIAIRSDLTEPDGAAALHAAVLDRLGPPDILVLNGPGPAPGPATGVGRRDAVGAVELLVAAQVDLIDRCLPRLREQGWGRILAVGSSGVSAPLSGLALSNLGRAALAGYLKTLAAEVAADGVTVNLLLPGRIDTDRVRSLDRAKAERSGVAADQVARESQQAIPAGRYGEPAGFGSAAAFLCGAPASYITGVALRVDGGLVPVL